MDLVTIIINENGLVNKTKLIYIHNRIKETIIRDILGINYGFYIVRVYKFVKNFKPPQKINLLNIFQQDVMIKLNLPSLMDYLSVAREYISIVVHQKQNITCPDCHHIMISEKTDCELHCEECGLIYDTRLPGVKDIESVNTSRSYYSLKMNLLKAIHKFEGKQSTININDLEIIHLEILKRKLNPQSLRCEHILKILKDQKLVKYYDEVYSLLPMLTNKPRKSIQTYVPQILKLHDELEYAYSTIKNPTRINSLNVYFKLYKLLKLCDIEFDITDLCTLKTEQKFEEHEEKWKEICKITGWNM
jgi:Poxvirus Late Transcription Factor VLTF3 like.